MRPRRALPRIALLACSGIAFSVASATAAGHPSLGARETDAVAAHTSSAAEVRRAFETVKINLAARTAGNSTQPVTVLTAVVPKRITHTRAWEVEIFLYPSTVLAAQAFDAGIGGWRDNGVPATRVNNVIVTVVPNGQQIGAYAPAFPMPQLVLSALRALTRLSP